MPRPTSGATLIAWMYEQVPALRGVVLSVHCHNDLGLATANSLVSVLGGARQIETCVNGIGERAGNAALEEVAMATRLHPEVYGVTTQLDHSQLYRTSRLVSQLTGMLVQPNKSVVGANAFAHHSGIHQDGMLKDRRTFEIMEPGQVGAGSTLVLGKLSGRHALRDRLEQLGYRLDGEELQRAFVRFKELADRKRDVTDRDLEAIVADERQGGEETFRLEHLQVSCGTNLRATATVRMLLSDGVSHEAVSIGDGPVDATYRAIDSLVQVEGGAGGVRDPGNHRRHGRRRRGERSPAPGRRVELRSWRRHRHPRRSGEGLRARAEPADRTPRCRSEGPTRTHGGG